MKEGVRWRPTAGGERLDRPVTTRCEHDLQGPLESQGVTPNSSLGQLAPAADLQRPGDPGPAPRCFPRSRRAPPEPINTAGCGSLPW